MATLSVTYTMVPDDYARAAEVNENFNDVIKWAATNHLNQDFADLKKALVWSLAGSDSALTISNSGTEGSVLITYSGVLATGKSSIKITSTGTQGNPTQGDAQFYIDEQNPVSNIPLVLLKNVSTGNFLTCKTGSSTVAAIADDGAFKCLNIQLNSGVTLSNWTGNLLVAGVKFGDTNGPQLYKVADYRLKLVTELQIDTDGPILSKYATSGLHLSETLRFYDSNGPILSRSANNRLNLQNELQINSGPVLSNVGGRTDFSAGIRINSLAPLDSNTDANTLLLNSKRLVVADSTVPVKIIWGVVGDDGSILSGTGFTVSHPSAGIYTINFTDAFSAVPAVSVLGNIYSWYYSAIDASSVTVKQSSLWDTAFLFIAIGSR